MGGTETGMNQFPGRNRLEGGLAPTSTKDKQNIPVFIRELIGHRNSPPGFFLHADIVWSTQSSAAYAVHRQGHQEHCALDLRQMAKDQAQ